MLSTNHPISSFWTLLIIFLSCMQVVLAADDSTTSKEYTDDKRFQQTVLDMHNTYRAQHNASKLEWNETLLDAAKELGKDCEMEHSGGIYGENLASGYENVTSAIIAWGEERRQYEFRGGSFSPATGHFTQLVWKSSRQVGCSRHVCDAEVKGWLLICEYAPSGNVIGAFERNVEKALPKNERATGEGQVDDRVPEPDEEMCLQGAICSVAGGMRAWRSWGVLGVVVGVSVSAML